MTAPDRALRSGRDWCINDQKAAGVTGTGRQRRPRISGIPRPLPLSAARGCALPAPAGTPAGRAPDHPRFRRPRASTDGGHGRPAPGISTRHQPVRDLQGRGEHVWRRGVAGAAALPAPPVTPASAPARPFSQPVAPFPALQGAREPVEGRTARRYGETRNLHGQNLGSAAGAARSRIAASRLLCSYAVPMLRVTSAGIRTATFRSFYSKHKVAGHGSSGCVTCWRGAAC